MSEKATLPTPSSAARVSPGCLSIFKGLFISKNAPDGRHLNESMNVIHLAIVPASFGAICTNGAYVFIPNLSVVCVREEALVEPCEHFFFYFSLEESTLKLAFFLLTCHPLFRKRNKVSFPLLTPPTHTLQRTTRFHKR